MRPKLLLGAALVTLALLTAGCTTKIETQQTEPFRIQLEGASRTVSVDEADDNAQEVEVQTCPTTSCSDEPRPVELELKVQQTSSTPCKLLVTVKDKATGEELERRVVDVGANATSNTSTTPGNGTGSGNTTNVQGQTVVQNIVVNVKGKNNLVVLTEAQQGSAQVNIAAHGSVTSGGATTTGTASSSTSSTSATSTTSSATPTSTTTYPAA